MTTRNKISEASSIKIFSPVGTFANGDTMSVTVYKDGSGTPESLTTGTVTEIGTTGVFYWPFSDLVTAPTVLTQYYWTMQDATTKKASGVIEFGGYVETISSIAGANSVTITVQEADTTAIASVEVQVLNSAQTLVLDSKVSDASGQVVFALDDGSYKVRMSKAQVSFTVPEDLTVSGTTVDTYNGDPITLTPGSGAGECEVSIYTSSQRPSTKLSTIEATATIKELPTLITGVYYSGQRVDGNYDTLTGRIYWILPRSAIVSFKVSDMGIEAEKTIPDSASADYSDL